MPALESLQVADYMEMLEMSNSRRHRYYEYLHASKTADSNDEVFQMSKATQMGGCNECE